MSSIVFFGKAHAGKSTLVGALVAHNHQLDLDLLDEKFARDIPNYDPSSLFSAIVDDTRNERMRRGSGSERRSTAPGSTKTRHYRNVVLEGDRRVTLIDTPGAEHLNRERDRGLFAGDVGVFCLEAEDVVNEAFFAKDQQYRTILRTLALWSGLARTRVIVALTKMDEVEFSEEVFNRSCDVLRELCGGMDLSVEFIPTAVLVRTRQSHNLFSRSPLLDWHRGPTLIEALNAHVGRAMELRDRNGGLLFSVDREFEKPQSRAGKTWQVKVLSGLLRCGDRVVMAPVSGKNKEFMPISAEVKALRGNVHRLESPEVLEEAGPGRIVGLDLKFIASEGRHGLGKDDFNAVYTTCGFAVDVPFAMSSEFAFTVPLEEGDLFITGRQFDLVWFGRNMGFAVRETEPGPESTLVKAGGLARPIAMPRLSTSALLRDAILIRNRSGRGPDYIRARLVGIG